MFDAYTSYEACKQNKWSKIGRELFLPGYKLTSIALPDLGDDENNNSILTPTSELCQDECNIRYDLLFYIQNHQERPSRGAPLLFCPPGEFIHKEKIFYMLFIFPEIPLLVHPCYLGRMGAPENHLITI